MRNWFSRRVIIINDRSSKIRVNWKTSLFTTISLKYDDQGRVVFVRKSFLAIIPLETYFPSQNESVKISLR